MLNMQSLQLIDIDEDAQRDLGSGLPLFAPFALWDPVYPYLPSLCHQEPVEVTEFEMGVRGGRDGMLAGGQRWKMCGAAGKYDLPYSGWEHTSLIPRIFIENQAKCHLARSGYITSYIAVLFVAYSWLPGLLEIIIVTKSFCLSTLAPCCRNIYLDLMTFIPSIWYASPRPHYSLTQKTAHLV